MVAINCKPKALNISEDEIEEITKTGFKKLEQNNRKSTNNSK
jgi:hypothetical protein